MLVIRMQRTGRKGYAQYRIVVQDSRQTPTSGRVIAHLGNYNPHTKDLTLDKEKATFYLKNGAHPSQRVSTFLKKESMKLPVWAEVFKGKKKKSIKNVEKLRKNKPSDAEATKSKPAELKEEVSKDEPKPEEAQKPKEQPKAETIEKEPKESKEEKPEKTDEKEPQTPKEDTAKGE